MGVRSTTSRSRPAGSLQRITRRAKGREYPYWRWRTYRRGDLGWERVDLLLGEEVVSIHETLDVPRVVSLPVRLMLPWRMPRRP